MAAFEDPSVRHIYLLRHGQAASNLAREYSELEQGPDGLTELGVWQAQRAGDLLRAVLRPGCRLVSSPLDRARQTAEIVAERITTDWTLYLDARLQEKHLDESFEGAARRAWAAIWEHSSGGSALCVTHGHIIQALVALSLGFPDMTRVHPVNCGLTYFRDGHVVALNMATHLADAEHPLESID